MSLHCPATVIVAWSEGDVRDMVERLRERRVAAVYTGPQPEAAQAGRRLAEELDAVTATLSGLGLGAIGSAESADLAFSQIEDELRSVADLHRGETVVVLAHAPSSVGLGALEVEIGDDGLRLVSRPGP